MVGKWLWLLFPNLFAQKVWYNDFKYDGAAVDEKNNHESVGILCIVILQISANHLDIDHINWGEPGFPNNVYIYIYI